MGFVCSGICDIYMWVIHSEAAPVCISINSISMCLHAEFQLMHYVEQLFTPTHNADLRSLMMILLSAAWET